MHAGVIQTKIEYLPEPLQQEVLDDIDFLLYKYHQQGQPMRQPKNLLRRQERVQRIDAVWDWLFVKYGDMPGSVDLIREDRAR
ncbi:MAG: DUF2281 domain-containing protein [Candidatus Vecturithrix sp.]|jgi:hypothetical protein|nr:DUF2281 domain-containing protein [Candidatus Vecturithrix sp.]